MLESFKTDSPKTPVPGRARVWPREDGTWMSIDENGNERVISQTVQMIAAGVASLSLTPSIVQQHYSYTPGAVHTITRDGVGIYTLDVDEQALCASVGVNDGLLVKVFPAQVFYNPADPSINVFGAEGVGPFDSLAKIYRAKVYLDATNPALVDSVSQIYYEAYLIVGQWV